MTPKSYTGSDSHANIAMEKDPLSGLFPRASSFTYIASLDGVRAVAVLAVMLVHANLPFGQGGWIGVDIFFVLSGFLITSVILKEMTRTNTFNFRQFYLNRILRLYPALVVFVVAVTVVELITEGRPGARDALLASMFSLLYLSNWATAFDWLYMGNLQHTWSLSIEEQFYLFWPLVLVTLVHRIQRIMVMLVAVCVLISASMVLRAILYHHNTAELSWRTYAGFDTRADSLLMGCLLGLVLARWSLSIPSKIAGILAAACLTIIVSAVFILDLGDAYGAMMNAYGYTVLAMITGLFILSLTIEPRSLVSRLFATGVFVWIGRRSYAIYLWHLPLFSRFHDSATLVTVAVCVLATIALAELSYRFVEQPFLKRKRGWVSSPDVARVAR